MNATLRFLSPLEKNTEFLDTSLDEVYLPCSVGKGGRPTDHLSKGLSFLHSLTRRSREHLRSGKDRKMPGIMVTP